jgi:flagellar biosynthesis protein FlhA
MAERTVKTFLPPLDEWQKGVQLALPIGVIAVLGIMILPVPPFLMDFFLSISITLAITILLIGFFVDKPLDFSVFPAILLVSTLFRLSLNIASTRLILLRGEQGPDAAGKVIASFGQFVVGGEYVVGLVVFVILVVINFVVITKGAGRIAEVAARFTLDAMPGKQMSIDADLNAGLIGEAEARERRERVSKEADFYGAMDGASKFVRGDAIAGILITAVNILGGLAVGVLKKGMPIGEAAQTYTLLTVGDGLVSQIPALLVSTAAGIVVSRTATEGDFATTVQRQLFGNPTVMFFARSHGTHRLPHKPSSRDLVLQSSGMGISRASSLTPHPLAAICGPPACESNPWHLGTQSDGC